MSEEKEKEIVLVVPSSGWKVVHSWTAEKPTETKGDK